MIYLDNSATTYPKPPCTAEAMNLAMKKFGANPGRGGNPLSLKAAEEVYKVREKAGKFFNAKPENIVFTQNATMASNMAIKGILDSNSHCLISNYEHNAVWRPVHKTCSYGVFEMCDTQGETLYRLSGMLRKNTKCIICTAVSNVTGRIMPVKAICSFARDNGLISIVDASQAAGYIPCDVKDLGCDILFTSGHKGLYGPFGTGLLVLNTDVQLKTLIEGGTGTTSNEANQPPFPPERYEAGTLNMCGIIGLGAGIDFVSKYGERINEKEYELTADLRASLVEYGVTVYDKEFNFTPVTSFNLADVSSSEVDQRLSEAGICVRSGLHCASLAHRTLGTHEKGTVRVSIGAFNTRRDINALLNVVKNI